MRMSTVLIGILAVVALIHVGVQSGRLWGGSSPRANAVTIKASPPTKVEVVTPIAPAPRWLDHFETYPGARSL